MAKAKKIAEVHRHGYVVEVTASYGREFLSDAETVFLTAKLYDLDVWLGKYSVKVSRYEANSFVKKPWLRKSKWYSRVQEKKQDLIDNLFERAGVHEREQRITDGLPESLRGL